MSTERMKVCMHGIYYISCSIIIILFVFLFAYSRVSVTKEPGKGGYETVLDYDVVMEKDDSLPAGIRQIYTFTLDGMEGSYCEFIFYCIHQNANVYLENECIYSMQADHNRALGESAGYVWNEVSFGEEDNGKRVTLEIIPVYHSSKNIVPLMYIGNHYDIARSIIMDGLPNLIFSFVVIVVGVIYIFFVLYNNRKTKVESDLSMLGIFSIQLGVWRIAESEAINMLFPGHPALSQLTFLMMMFMCLSAALYVKELYSTKNNLMWYIPCGLGIINIIMTICLQCFGLVDMRQMLPFTHIVMGTFVAVTVIMTIYEIRVAGFHRKLRLNAICLSICFAGAAIDMLIYYITSGSAPSVLGMSGFLVYILVLGISTMREVKEWIRVGMKAQEYEQLAYHDQLTGLYNRTAYEEYIHSAEFDLTDCIVLVMDLNNLKICNDKLGHDKGDVYIRECAKLIREKFGDIGRCYRVGGDEFYVLLEGSTEAMCRERIEELKENVRSSNVLGEEFRMGIACGYMKYDSNHDRNIDEMVRRADKAMYKDKTVNGKK